MKSISGFLVQGPVLSLPVSILQRTATKFVCKFRATSIRWSQLKSNQENSKSIIVKWVNEILVSASVVANSTIKRHQCDNKWAKYAAGGSASL